MDSVLPLAGKTRCGAIAAQRSEKLRVYQGVADRHHDLREHGQKENDGGDGHGVVANGDAPSGSVQPAAKDGHEIPVLSLDLFRGRYKGEHGKRARL